MDWKNYLYPDNEKPLDRLVEGYSNTSVFRTIAFVGDSLSSGEFETLNENGEPGYYDLYEYSFGQYIARKNGLKAYNFSRGGLTAATYIRDFYEGHEYWNPEYAAQAYVMALGVNDICFGGYETGSVFDVDINDPANNKPTFAGNYGAIVQRYKKIAPDAKFFFVTFAKTSNKLFASKAEEHRKILYDLAELFDNCYVIDLYEYGPVHDDEFCKKYFMYGHMNPMGYLHTANMIDSYIDYIVRTNPDDFKNAGFINTDIKYK